MRIRSIFILATALFIAGCQKNKNEEVSRFHEDGRAKPIVLLTPVIDSTSYETPWSLSEEFSSLLTARLGKKADIYLTSSDELHSGISYQHNPFSSDISWMKIAYPHQEFVIFLELIEHVNVSADSKIEKEKIHDVEKLKEISSNLEMGIRLRLIDLRTDPKIVLQEVVTDSYFISKNHIDSDYSRTIWGSEEYLASPMGIAHNQIIGEIADHIYDYVLLAKSR